MNTHQPALGNRRGYTLRQTVVTARRNHMDNMQIRAVDPDRPAPAESRGLL